MLGHMTKYWHHHPPAHILVAGYMVYMPKQDAKSAPDLASNIASLGGDLRDELPEHLRSALDTFSCNSSNR